jgi:phenylalanyl-tRNA synthetase beta chain
MKIPMKWLREYVDVKLDPAKYADRMIWTGTAVEGWEETGAQFEGVVVGKVVTCEDHPNSDHLHICSVDVGASENLQIVCGAPNARAGIYVAVALDGAKLPGGKIKKGKIRGVESCGMLCSGPELEVPAELYPHIGDQGIMELSGETALGADVKIEFGLGDTVMDYEILANRPDCLSAWGIARESAAALSEYCVMPEISVVEDGKGAFSDYASVEVLDAEACPRYCARVIADVKIAPSPKWLREYLYGAGVRPINNIVDITNYVMLETGHPMHAFDLSKVREHAIVVRRAHPGEELTTLDGKQYTLDESMLVIADRERATGLAGIMGGEESEITEETKSVLFECAAFDRTNNRLTSRKLGIRTEASGRFEKGVCPATAMDALARACMLVNMLECGKVVPGAYDNYPAPKEIVPVEASVARVCALTGVEIPGEAMEDILSKLYIETELNGDQLICTPPAWRGDIESEADIAEEVLRLYGYEHIHSTLMDAVTMPGKRSAKQLFIDRVRRAVAAMGFFETLNYSFVTPKWLEKLGLPEGDWRKAPIRIMNPLGEDTSVMRTTLVPTMLDVIAANVNRGNGAGKLFEISHAFKPTAEGDLPEEKLTLCLGMYGEGGDFYAVKNPVEWLLGAFGVKADIEATGDPYYHPGRKAVLRAKNADIAQLGEVHPDVSARFGLDDVRVYVAEVDLDALMALEVSIYGIKELPKYPAVSRDLALVVDEAEGAGAVLEAIRKAGGRILEDVTLFDVYRDPRLGESKKSLAYAITFRAADRTLTDAEIGTAMEKVLKAVEKEFGAEIRK